jgi:hypothetical protein
MLWYYTSVVIAMGYGLDGPGSILGKTRFLSLLHSVETGSGPHTASYPMSAGEDFLGGKVAGV